MIKEVLASLAMFLVLTFIGIGPSTLLFYPGYELLEKSRINALLSLALAPVLGLSITTLLAFPLYRYWAPVKVWGLGIVIFLIMLSLLAWSIRRKSIPVWRDWAKGDVLVLTLALAIVWISLSLIPIFRGISRVIFISNPSDSLVYMTLSETVRLASWEPLEAAGYVGFPNQSVTSLFKLFSNIVSSISGFPIDFPEIDFDEFEQSSLTAKLIDFSPTALYSARYIALPFRLSTVINLALFSQLTDIGIERLLYGFDLAISLCSASVCFALFRLLKVNLIWSGLGTLALIFGYYNIMIFDHDAHSQVHCLPLLLLLTLLRIYTYHQTRGIFFLNIMSGLILGAIVCAYTEFTIPLVTAFTIEIFYFSGWPILSRKRHIYDVAIIFFGAILALTISGQVIYLLRSLIRQLTFVSHAQSAIGSTLLDYFIQQDSISSIQRAISTMLGLSWLYNYFSISQIGWVERLSSLLIGLIFLGLLLALVIIHLRKDYRLLVIAIPLISYFSVSAYFLLIKQDNYSFFKVISTGFFTLILVSGYLSAESSFLRKSLSFQVTKLSVVSASPFLGILLMLQIAFGCSYVLSDIFISPPEYVVSKKNNDYNFIAYHRVLHKLEPRELLVHAPASEDWWHSALLMLSLKDFNPHFQSGYLYDNSADRLFHLALEMHDSPDYVLIAKSDDYLSRFVEEGKVKLIFEGREYSVYKILDIDPQHFLYRYPAEKEVHLKKMYGKRDVASSSITLGISLEQIHSRANIIASSKPSQPD